MFDAGRDLVFYIAVQVLRCSVIAQQHLAVNNSSSTSCLTLKMAL